MTLHNAGRLVGCLLLVASCSGARGTNTAEPDVARNVDPRTSKCLGWKHQSLRDLEKEDVAPLDPDASDTVYNVLMVKLQEEADPERLASFLASSLGLRMEAALRAIDAWAMTRVCPGLASPEEKEALGDIAVRLAPTAPFVVDLFYVAYQSSVPWSQHERLSERLVRAVRSLPSACETIRILPFMSQYTVGQETYRDLLSFIRGNCSRHVTDTLLDALARDEADREGADIWLDLLHDLLSAKPTVSSGLLLSVGQHAFLAAANSGDFARAATILDSLPPTVRADMLSGRVVAVNERVSGVLVRLDASDARPEIVAVWAETGLKDRAAALFSSAQAGAEDVPWRSAFLRYLTTGESREALFDIAGSLYTTWGKSALWRILLDKAVLREGYQLHSATEDSSDRLAGAIASRLALRAIEPWEKASEAEFETARAGFTPIDPKQLGRPFDLFVYRAQRHAEDVFAIAQMMVSFPAGEIGTYGMWLLRSLDGGSTWRRPLLLALQSGEPYFLPVDTNETFGVTPRLAVRVGRLDAKGPEPASPFGLRTGDKTSTVIVSASLDELEKDSDSDGLPDLEEDRFLTNPRDSDTDDDGIVDLDDRFPTIPQGPATLRSGILDAALVLRFGHLPWKPNEVTLITPDDIVRRLETPIGAVVLRGARNDFAGCRFAGVRVLVMTERELELASRRSVGLESVAVEILLLDPEQERAIVRLDNGGQKSAYVITRASDGWRARMIMYVVIN